MSAARPTQGYQTHLGILAKVQPRELAMRMLSDVAQGTRHEQLPPVAVADYEGGHGWKGDVYGNIVAGIEWLEKTKTPTTAPTTKLLER